MAPMWKYPEELHARALRLWWAADPKPPIAELAERLGVHREKLRLWIRADEARREHEARKPAG